MHAHARQAVLAAILVSFATASSLATASPPSGGSWTRLPEVQGLAASGAGVAWTGHEMIVWGGCCVGRSTTNQGARYAPTTGTWTAASNAGAPSPREQAVVIWTGTVMLVWGGINPDFNPTTHYPSYPSDGARYDPTTDTWAPLSTLGAPTGRLLTSAVWTGQELLVWGGQGSTGYLYLGDGAAYNPQTDAWRSLPSAGAPSPRSRAPAVWTGQEMIVWGGLGHSPELAQGAAYAPATDTWRPIAKTDASPWHGGASVAWTGHEMLVWGGGDELSLSNGGGVRYNPATDTWSPMADSGAPTPRFEATAVWTGRELLVWGGYAHSQVDSHALADGARYDPVTDTWTPLPATEFSGEIWSSTVPWAVWTGSQMLMWGGGSSFPPKPPRGAAFTPDNSLTVPHDNRYFPQTGYRIDDDTIWDYFQHRGGLVTFGEPTSRTFLFQGFTVQFFQRRIVQLDAQGHARLLNLLDPGLLPYASFNGSTFPSVDAALVAAAPDPTDLPATLAFVRQHAPDSFQGMPVNFAQTFTTSVPAQVAFPTGGDPGLLVGIDLELWGIPTSPPAVDPTNQHFIYLRWQRGIMHYDAGCRCTHGILLADYLKSILTGEHLPPDLAQEAQGSPFAQQYDPSQPHWVRDPTLLPDTDLTDAFTPR